MGKKRSTPELVDESSSISVTVVSGGDITKAFFLLGVDLDRSKQLRKNIVIQVGGYYFRGQDVMCDGGGSWLHEKLAR